MKGLLLDQGLPRSTASLLAGAGYSAVHAAEIGLSRASDSGILAYARQHDLMVVTLDADFHMLLAVQGAALPSVIRLRQQRLNAEQAAIAIQGFLSAAVKRWNAGLLSRRPRRSTLPSAFHCQNRADRVMKGVSRWLFPGAAMHSILISCRVPIPICGC
jgi:predicted nuclease of predicted toxin-antitoxin system